MSEPLFGWQYLHVVGPDMAVNAVFHRTDIFGERPEPYVSLGYNVHGDHGRASVPAQSLADSVLRTDDGYRIDIQAGPLRLAGTVALAPDRPPSRSTLFLQAGERTNHWEVLAADGRFSGELTCGTVTHPCSGTFYMDRQWGDLLLQHAVREWAWGHFAAEGTTILFFHVRTVDGATVTRAAQCWDSAWQQDARLGSSHLSSLRSALDLGSLRGSFAVELAAGGAPTEVRFFLQPDGLMRLRENEAHPGFVATYARWHVRGSAARGGKQASVAGVTEYLRIRN